MDHRKKAMILDGATDLYTLIRDILDMTRGDERVAQLDEATERYLKDVLALKDRDQPKLHLVEEARLRWTSSAEKLSRKEWARQQRRAAYLRAKEFRANDPKQLAFKEAMKERQRDANAAAKERRKASAKDEKARRAEHRPGDAGSAAEDVGEPGDEKRIGGCRRSRPTREAAIVARWASGSGPRRSPPVADAIARSVFARAR